LLLLPLRLSFLSPLVNVVNQSKKVVPAATTTTITTTPAAAITIVALRLPLRTHQLMHNPLFPGSTLMNSMLVIYSVMNRKLTPRSSAT